MSSEHLDRVHELVPNLVNFGRRCAVLPSSMPKRLDAISWEPFYEYLRRINRTASFTTLRKFALELAEEVAQKLSLPSEETILLDFERKIDAFVQREFATSGDDSAILIELAGYAENHFPYHRECSDCSELQRLQMLSWCVLRFYLFTSVPLM